MTGVPVVGAEPGFDVGEWSGGTLDPQVLVFWERCDINGANCERITAPDPWWSRPTLSRADIGHTLRVGVVLSNPPEGEVSAISEPSAVIAPAKPLENVSPPGLDQFGTPVATYTQGGWTGDWKGVPEIAAQWQRCDPLTEDPITGELDCVDIPGAEDEDYEPVAADVGFRLRLKVTATTPGDSETLYSDMTDDLVTVYVHDDDGAFTGPAVVGETITADSTVTADVLLPIKTTYTFWRLMGPGEDPIELQTSTAPDYTFVSGDLGHRIEIEMTADVWRLDEAEPVTGTAVWVTTPKVEGLPTNDTTPTIDGDLWTGSTLTADPGAWHGGAGPLDYSHRWRRCDDEGDDCVDIPDANKATYRLVEADEGSTVRVEVTASHQTASGTAASAPTTVIDAAGTPVNTNVPEISGEPVELETLTATSGTWTGDGPIAYAYQWHSCSDTGDDCVDIEGETASTLRLSEYDIDTTIKVSVTASNASTGETTTSDATEPVVSAPPPEIQELPAMDVLGRPEAGATLVTDGGAWLNVDTDTLEYQWQRCGLLGAGCETIAGADAATHDLTDDDIGKRLQVTVSGRNSTGLTAATSELSPVIGESSGDAAGTMVYVTDEFEDALVVSKVDGSDGSEIVTCTTLGHSNACELRRPRISPNLKQIVFELGPTKKGGQPTILLTDNDGANARTRTEGSSPAWSADGTRIIYSATDSAAPSTTRIATIAAADRNGDTAEWITESTANLQTAPDVSPYGDLIVYAETDPATDVSSLYLTSPGGDATKLELGPSIVSATSPSFNDDDGDILFMATTSDLEDHQMVDQTSVWAIAPDGSNLRRLTPAEDIYYGTATVAGGKLFVTGYHACPQNSRCASNPIITWQIDPDGTHREPVFEGRDPDVAKPKRRAHAALLPRCDDPLEAQYDDPFLLVDVDPRGNGRDKGDNRFSKYHINIEAIPWLRGSFSGRP